MINIARGLAPEIYEMIADWHAEKSENYSDRHAVISLRLYKMARSARK